MSPGPSLLLCGASARALSEAPPGSQSADGPGRRLGSLPAGYDASETGRRRETRRHRAAPSTRLRLPATA